MAVVQNPFLSTDARGSLSGITASAGRGGKFVKGKSMPSTARPPAVNTVRSILGYLSRQWGELTAGERASWEAWAADHPGTDKFGEPFLMSGFNAYIMLNHTAMRAGGSAAQQDLPPVDPPPESIDWLSAVTGIGNPGEIDITWLGLGTGVAADYWEIQMAGPFLSPGRTSVDSRFAREQWIAGNVYLTTVASLDEGMWYWFRARYITADGQVTAWGYSQATPMLTP